MELEGMSITVAVDAHVRLCMQSECECQPCMLMDEDRWSNKTRLDAQYEHGVQPVGL
jgi:hypothetical protein